jgi:hypothetical protein
LSIPNDHPRADRPGLRLFAEIPIIYQKIERCNSPSRTISLGMIVRAAAQKIQSSISGSSLETQLVHNMDFVFQVTILDYDRFFSLDELND